MTEKVSPRLPMTLLHSLDPRSSLAAGAMWLIVGLTVTFSVAAAVWVGSIARANLLEQHMRRLSLETDQLSSELGQAVAARLDAIRAAERLLRPSNGAGVSGGMNEVFNELVSAYPQLDWIAAADSNGVLAARHAGWTHGSDISKRPWFIGGLRGPWIGVIEDGQASAGGASAGSLGSPASTTAALGDLAAPVRDATGRLVGVIAAHLSWRRAPHHPERLTDEANAYGTTEAYVLDRDGVLLVAPEALRNRPWNGVPIDQPRAFAGGSEAASATPQFERLPDERRILVARAPLDAGSEAAASGWQVQLSEPIERVYQRAHAVAFEILWVSMGLGAAAALLGVLGARQLTGRLQRLALSVASVGHDAAGRIEIPPGGDEVAQLARAFAQILGDLQQERRELQTLSNELERRVAVRTREVERLAEEARYAAIVRERLKIARDLHDTLAHSMMAILSEIRFLRRLHARDPAALAEELVRAEQIAHEGLKEARTAITQMRGNSVRETGLGPALAGEFERFVDRTGLSGEFSADTESARFGDERAETLLRMAQEALRNVERHAMATRVSVWLSTADGGHLELRVEDDGVGFDPQVLRPGHYGIVGIREQAELIGARLRIDSAPEGGTTVSITLPMSPVAFQQNEH